MDRWEYAVLGLIALIAIAAGTLSTGAPIAAYLSRTGMEAVRLSLIMAWETWWALVLGFTIAGAVEAWVPKGEIADLLEGQGPREIVIGSFFGFVSSSCSYSAIATAKNLFKKDASAAAALGAFMFASTNLVIEIGFVMWVLLGWQFVVADFIGGGILIILLALAFRFLVPDRLIVEARQHAVEHTSTGHDHGYSAASIREQATSLDGWRRLARKQLMEWKMLYEDILVGFVLAGIIGAFVPHSVWIALFSGQQFGLPIFVLWTAALGAIIGVLTFVCSVGNVPFAAILWNNGLPFGSVLSYIYADLIVPPIMDAYRKYYGGRFAAVLSLLIFAAAVVTGFIIHFLFLSTGFVPTGTARVVERSIELNYKAVMNGVFTLVFIGLYLLRRE